ncbi:MAG: hypothetical protein WA840_01025 [Caulobacteraceae bacterium]
MSQPLSGKPTFGAGRVFATANIVNPTPRRALVPQSQSIDFKRKVESLYGENQLAVAVGAGELEVTGKVEYGKTSSGIIYDMIFGASAATGSFLEADSEAATVPAATAFLVTVANATDYEFDLGVVNAETGVVYSCVAAGSEMAGLSYSVQTSGANKGKYTFGAGDANSNVKISYIYSVATTGQTVALTNQLQGLTGSFQAVHVLPWGAEQDMYVFNSCIASSGGVSLKTSGFASNTLEYTACADGNNELGTATFAEAA